MELNHNMDTFRLSILVFVILAVAIAASQTGCILSGISYPGGDFDVGVIKESKEECQKYCQDTSGCLYFTWVDDTHPDPSYQKKCYPKHMIAKSKKKEGLYSGPKYCHESCDDGILNQDEELMDCGGSCLPCPGSESKFKKSALDEHNRLRALHGSDPLILDGKLSRSAAYWAKYLAKVVGKMGHSGGPENVFECSGCACDDDAGKPVTKSWYDEIEKYDFENVENNLPLEQFKQIGHFTQVVWKRATKMGIGKASANGKCFVVGQYDGGNYGSAEAFKNNVKKPL